MRFLYALTSTFAGDNKLVLSNVRGPIRQSGFVSQARSSLLIRELLLLVSRLLLVPRKSQEILPVLSQDKK